jgi:inhibitor of cysteine peptidase
VKKNLLLTVSLLVLSVLVFAGCGTVGDISLDEGDDGSRITLEAGQTVDIRLEGNPTTGFTWEVAEVDDAILRQIGEIEFDPFSGLIGSAGIQTLRFEAVGSGQMTLKLAYHRPWETEPSLDTFNIHVTVP